MVEKQDEIEKLKNSMTALEHNNFTLRMSYDELEKKHRRTRRRLFNHLYFTKFILGTILIWSVLMLVVAGGFYAFLKHDTEVGGITFNDEIASVPFFGLAIIGWLTIVVLVLCMWVYLLIWYIDADYEREN